MRGRRRTPSRRDAIARVIGAIVLIVLAYAVLMLAAGHLPPSYGACAAFLVPPIAVAAVAGAFARDRKREPQAVGGTCSGGASRRSTPHTSARLHFLDGTKRGEPSRETISTDGGLGKLALGPSSRCVTRRDRVRCGRLGVRAGRLGPAICAVAVSFRTAGLSSRIVAGGTCVRSDAAAIAFQLDISKRVSRAYHAVCSRRRI